MTGVEAEVGTTGGKGEGGGAPGLGVLEAASVSGAVLAGTSIGEFGALFWVVCVCVCVCVSVANCSSMAGMSLLLLLLLLVLVLLLLLLLLL